MTVRYLKISLVVFVGLLGIVSGLQNIFNLRQGYDTVAYVLSMQEHTIYPTAMAMSIKAPALVWLAFCIIVLAELGSGLLCMKGAIDLWSARQSGTAAFHAAKTYAVLGIGGAVLVWFGLFGVIADAFFGMWQTAVGEASVRAAFQYSAMCALILIFVLMADESGAGAK